MQVTREDVLLATGVAFASATAGALGAYFFGPTRNLSDRKIRKLATPEKPIDLTAAGKQAVIKFGELYSSIATDVAFDKSWITSNGRMVGALNNDLTYGAYRAKDPAGRRIVILVSQAASSVYIAYQRYAGDDAPIETLKQVRDFGSNSASSSVTELETMLDMLSAIVKDEKVVNGAVVDEQSAKAA